MTAEIPAQTRLYALGLSVCAVAALASGCSLAGYTLERRIPGRSWRSIVVNAVAERSGVWITRTTQMSIALLPTLFAAVLFGPLAAGIVNASSMLGDPELFSSV